MIRCSEVIAFVCALQFNGEKRETSAAQNKTNGVEQRRGVNLKWTSKGGNKRALNWLQKRMCFKGRRLRGLLHMLRVLPCHLICMLATEQFTVQDHMWTVSKGLHNGSVSLGCSVYCAYRHIAGWTRIASVLNFSESFFGGYISYLRGVYWINTCKLIEVLLYVFICRSSYRKKTHIHIKILICTALIKLKT